MSGIDLWQEIQETKKLLDIALKEAKARGIAKNAAEAKYYTIKDLRVRELMDENKSGTVISMIIKGEPGVNEAMNEFHDCEVEYNNAIEAIRVYKRWFDFLREQYQREWTQAGRD